MSESAIARGWNWGRLESAACRWLSSRPSTTSCVRIVRERTAPGLRSSGSPLPCLNGGRFWCDGLGVCFTCGSGEIGRRARLRGVWSNPCRFKSCLPHFLVSVVAWANWLGTAADDVQWGCETVTRHSTHSLFLCAGSCQQHVGRPIQAKRRRPWHRVGAEE